MPLFLRLRHSRRFPKKMAENWGFLRPTGPLIAQELRMETIMQADETDLLYGVAAIAAHLQMTEKQVYHLHDQRHIPTFKIGGKVCARRSTLAKHFEAQEAAARAAGRE